MRLTKKILADHGIEPLDDNTLDDIVIGALNEALPEYRVGDRMYFGGDIIRYVDPHMFYFYRVNHLDEEVYQGRMLKLGKTYYDSEDVKDAGLKMPKRKKD